MATSSFSISNFVNGVGKIARPNLFKVKFIGLPAIISLRSPINLSNLNEFEFRCERAELPGRSVATVDEITTAGPTVKLPYDMTYNDMQLTFICSEDMKERILFEFWMSRIVEDYGMDGGLVRYYDEFAQGSQIQISQLDEKGKMIAQYVLQDAFPIQLSPMNLAWEESNTYQRFNVTLAYRYHKFSTPNYNYVPDQNEDTD